MMKTFIYILSIIIPLLLLGYYDTKYIKDKNFKKVSKTLIKDFLLIFFLTPTILRFFGYSDLIQPAKQNYSVFISYFGIALLVVLVFLTIKKEFYKHFEVDEIMINHKGWVFILYFLSVAFVFGGVIFITATIWGKKVYNNASLNQIWITVTSPLVGTDSTIINDFVDDAFLLTLSVTLLFGMIFHKRVNYKFKRKFDKGFVISEMTSRVGLIVISLTVLISGFTYSAIKLNAQELWISMTQTSTFIDDNYVDPSSVDLKFPTQKRNLIHIYLESYENSYFSKEYGGNMDENLMPNLLELSKEGYSFSHLEKGEGFGGPLDTYGSNWSVASMVNQFFGVPMKAPSSRNHYGSRGGFLPGAVGVGDILNKVGYEQTMMVGADALFGGLKYMFEDHGGFKVIDHKYAQENGMIPNDYDVKWGFEDEKLYKFAQDELTRLAATGKPFHFLMENADTHTPGFAFIDGKPSFSILDRDFDYAETIKFSEKHLVEFVRWIQAQPFYENTTVVIIGDHLSMDSLFFFENDFNNYLRTTYNLILNPSKEVNTMDETRFYNRKWSNYDFMPTILASIGVHIDGDVLGLGRNLFSDEKTLFERDGYEFVNSSYVPKSKLYLNKFCNSKHNYNGENLSTY